MIERDVWRTRGLSPKKVVRHPVTGSGGAVDVVVLHHSVTAPGPLQSVSRSIERYHLGKDYYDIAYNFLVNGEGALEGRGARVQGGATGAGMDSKSLSVCVLGNFEDSGEDEVTVAVRAELVKLLGELVDAGYVAADFTLRAHSEFKATACCGKRLRAAIPSVVEAVRDRNKVKPAEQLDAPEWLNNGMSDAQKLSAIAAILKG